MPALVDPGPRGWATGVWEWSRADLLRLADLSLLHLLERIPGITAVRATAVNHPESSAVFGATAGAIRYEIDGFVLDPLTAPTFDPSRLPLVTLEHVRVERRVTGATVRIRTLSPVEVEPYSVIEAATGDYRTNLFRGTFMTSLLGGGLAVGFESLGSQLLPGPGASLQGASLKWTLAGEDSGIQFELRQADVSREGVGEPLDGLRRDWAVRARARFGPVTAEGYAGASSVEDEVAGLVLREGAPQGGVRLNTRLVAPVPVEAEASLRFRGHPRLPAQELETQAWAYPTYWLAVGTELIHGRWDGAPYTGRLAVQARAGPLLGASASIGLFTAQDLLPGDELGAVEGRWSRDGARLGLEYQRRRWLMGAAVVRASADVVPPFGLAFDIDGAAAAGGDANGLEALVALPTPWRPLRIEGWFVGMDVPDTWPYFPAQQWNLALVYHDLPLPTDNLELYGRAEHVFRGDMVVPQAEGLVPVGAYQATNLELTIRVMTVRAFVRWQNVFHQLFQEDLPGFARPGQHIIYGVKWEFWN